MLTNGHEYALPDDIAGDATRPIELRFRGRDDWQAGLQRHLLALECSVADALSFDCHIVLAHLRGVTVAELRSDAAMLLRRAANAGRGEREVVKVLWQLAGRSQVQQSPNSATLQQGHWTLCDPACDYTLELGRGSRLLMVLVPRAQCPGWLPALHALAARALPMGSPGNIALAALTAMLRNPEPLDAQSEGTLHDLTMALIEQGLSHELEARGLAALAEQESRLPQVQAYVLEHLADPALNVGRLAAVFGMSRRSLYNLFVPSGVTPHAFIQGARLDRASALLKHPGSRHTAVAAIARQCGFVDPAHFTRAFHAHYGSAPTAWRDTLS